MKNQIILEALGLFLNLGFKNVTMEHIAQQTGISKKTIYVFFESKELLVRECTSVIYASLIENITLVLEKNYNAVEEAFYLIQIYKQMFRASGSSTSNQLKKNYPTIYRDLIIEEMSEFDKVFRLNIEKGIAQEFYKKEIKGDYYKFFYYTLLFNLNNDDIDEKQPNTIELDVLEYHTRAIATAKGTLELEKQLKVFKGR